MVFSSETFLFLFLPGFLALYYLTPWRWKSATLLAGSYVFYAWWRVDFLLLLIGTTVWTYMTGRAIRASEGARRRMWTGIGVAGCLAVLGGLWHGAAWTYVLWGAWHGGWLALERYTGWAKSRSPAALLRTLLLVLLGWVMFRATSVAEAGEVLAGMAGLNGIGMSATSAFQMTGESLVFLALAIFVAAAEPGLRRSRVASVEPAKGGGAVTVANTLLPSLATLIVAILAVLKLSEQSFSPFLYFQF
ncbi:hypothetical protein [Salipiger mucosus]|uniref:Putative poly(Beta-D-mannuronate) O-acetylase n=1 Tax=Salipiger mucosus DSM 16094 TaxID=1123237 RepID=S9R285_9RHOB|nr:hypothetical protein [Salipiger mucosus]EPX86002.1 putative poly(beta-D-mannuronate) O-acetylase [Salipiger mucosus DSM 16094]